MSAPQSGPAVTIRRAKPEDAPACGRICYDAFRKINADHNFPPEIPSAEAGVRMMTQMFTHPLFYCVVAEQDGRVAGSNCLDERSSVAGIGPITIDPAAQNAGIGRALMTAVMDRTRGRGNPGVRLVQVAFHSRSLSLYTKLGFDAREPLSLMQGEPLRKKIDGCVVRLALGSDLEACNRVCGQVHGHDRGGEVADALKQGSAHVVERHGRITGYTTGFAYFGHSVAESNLDLQALIGAAESFASSPGFLLPTRNAALFRWCLENGLRVQYPMTLMTVGLYNEPNGAWLPSILY
ncbi:MAG: GNAT family N-acetyltransferase [Acidobacteriia bacterium]|nr:GNAT family N-acetyltransferase [Terriglobia bacterium]